MVRFAEPIVLSVVERGELDRLVRGHSTPQQLALRARIILLAAEGIGNRERARRLGITVQTVRCWRRRWDDEPDLALADRLADAPRPGTPPTFTPEQICAIVALACEPPDARCRSRTGARARWPAKRSSGDWSKPSPTARSGVF
jgi:transposase